VASPLHDAVHDRGAGMKRGGGGDASANQRWWSVGWKIAKEQRDVTKDFWNFVCQIWCSYACVHKFITHNGALLCIFLFLMLVSISFSILLEQVYVVFMRQ